jgi:hypothetical protein
MKIAKQPIIEIVNEKLNYDVSGDYVNRYFVRRFDNNIGEISKQNYQNLRENPFFVKLIIKWYIRGSRDFVRTSNQSELDRAEKQIPGIKKIIVNPLQLYQGVS